MTVLVVEEIVERLDQRRLRLPAARLCGDIILNARGRLSDIEVCLHRLDRNKLVEWLRTPVVPQELPRKVRLPSRFRPLPPPPSPDRIERALDEVIQAATAAHSDMHAYWPSVTQILAAGEELGPLYAKFEELIDAYRWSNQVIYLFYAESERRRSLRYPRGASHTFPEAHATAEPNGSRPAHEARKQTLPEDWQERWDLYVKSLHAKRLAVDDFEDEARRLLGPHMRD